jgi:hypothetical protein
VGFFSLAKYKQVERLETHVTATIPVEGLERIWFAPSGDLAGIGVQKSRLSVRVWSRTGAPVRMRELDLAAAKSSAKPVFAVSAEGTEVAWVDDTSLRLTRIAGTEPESRSLTHFKKAAPITGLAFAGPGKLAALYGNGELELRELAGGRVVASTRLEMAEADLLLSNGLYLAAYSSGSGAAVVFDTTGDRFSLIENKKYPQDNLTMTLSPSARLAVGTREAVEQLGNSFRSPGPVRSMSFLDRNRVLIGGDFEGVYLVGPNQGPQQVAGAGKETTLVASSGMNFAFGGGKEISLASGRMIQSREYLGMGLPRLWVLLALLGLYVPLLMYFFYGTFGYIFRKLTSVNIAEPEEGGKLANEGPIPDALVEACRNGDCVLWAGSGLGAQGGLPNWTQFLRETLDWAVSGNHLTADAARAGLSELAEGKAGLAADRIASSIEDRRSLHAYLSQRFRVYSDLPAAHQLLRELDFPALVTTSFDNLLDRAFPHSGGRIYTAETCSELLRAAARHEFLLLKPFGTLDEPETIRLGPAECGRVIGDNPAVSELMGELFRTRVFLFIGASLDGLERDLTALSPPAEAGRKHFALVPTNAPGWEAAAERLTQRYAIATLPYTASTPLHPEVVDFLTKLRGLIHERSYSQESFEAAE